MSPLQHWFHYRVIIALLRCNFCRLAISTEHRSVVRVAVVVTTVADAADNDDDDDGEDGEGRLSVIDVSVTNASAAATSVHRVQQPIRTARDGIHLCSRFFVY